MRWALSHAEALPRRRLITAASPGAVATVVDRRTHRVRTRSNACMSARYHRCLSARSPAWRRCRRSRDHQAAWPRCWPTVAAVPNRRSHERTCLTNHRHRGLAIDCQRGEQPRHLPIRCHRPERGRLGGGTAARSARQSPPSATADITSSRTLPGSWTTRCEWHGDSAVDNWRSGPTTRIAPLPPDAWNVSARGTGSSSNSTRTMGPTLGGTSPPRLRAGSALGYVR